MPRIGGSVVLDLRIDDEHSVHRLIQSATGAPFGADVALVVEPHQFVPTLSLTYLREHGAHLGSITVQCSDPRTIMQWVAALGVECAA